MQKQNYTKKCFQRVTGKAGEELKEERGTEGNYIVVF